MLIKGEIANKIITYLEEISQVEQTDYKKAISEYATHIEAYMYEAIKNLTITIPPGAIQVQIPAGGVAFNIQPIILNFTVT